MQVKFLFLLRALARFSLKEFWGFPNQQFSDKNVGTHGSCVRVNNWKSGSTFGRTGRASLHFGGSVSDLQLAGSVRMAGVLAVKAFLRASGPFGSFRPVKRTDAPLWKHVQPCPVAGRRIFSNFRFLTRGWGPDVIICGFCCKFVVRMVGKGLENSTDYYGKYRQQYNSQYFRGGGCGP